ncbi:DUF6221 family protein [Streptomyces sp. NPDC048057]|uniref:DUF6221 family protein n=1 Tax=Streptomyces sp. NPDC048057 TaxID=3155628 RepID=UPI0033CB780B
MDDLIAFLRAHIAEDTAVAETAGGSCTYLLDDPSLAGLDTGDRAHVARQSPFRTLSDAAAIMELLHRYENPQTNPAFPPSVNKFTAQNEQLMLADVLRVLAHAHATHPDYRTEWRPEWRR